MKLSLHSQRGAAIAGHNDGSMYRYTDARFTAGRPKNVHWDAAHGVVNGNATGMTVEAVNRFENAVLKPEYERMCNSNSWAKNPSRRKTWTDWKAQKQNQLTETIVQIGDKDDHPSSPAALAQAVNETVRTMTKAGLTVIAFDLHEDEATPHAHIIWTGVVDGKINVKKCLEKHGYKAAKGKDASGSTPLAAFTAELRQNVENAVDDVFARQGYDALDRERESRPGKSLKQFKADAEREREAARKVGYREGYDAARLDYEREELPQLRETLTKQVNDELEMTRNEVREAKEELKTTQVELADVKSTLQLEKLNADAYAKRVRDEAEKDAEDIRKSALENAKALVDTLKGHIQRFGKSPMSALAWLLQTVAPEMAEDVFETKENAPKAAELGEWAAREVGGHLDTFLTREIEGKNVDVAQQERLAFDALDELAKRSSTPTINYRGRGDRYMGL